MADHDEKHSNEKHTEAEHHHPHLPFRAGRHRLAHFLRPDGKKVHIAGSPDEYENLKRRLSTVQPREDDWEVVIHGSLEHVNALRETHSHQMQLREGLRERHGNEFDELEKVIKELDHISNELHRVSEHAVNLDANFSKYGYSAHIRTIPKSGESSSAASTHGEFYDDEHEHHDWEAEKSQGEKMMFWKKPVMRQYLHKSLLWRASDATEAASYELFIDLFYVGILAISGDGAAEEASGQSLLRFSITFILGWKLWTDVGTFISWISADDIIRRLSVLFILVFLLGLTTNMSGSFEGTYKPLIAFYIGSRWFGTLYFLWMAYLIPMVRGSMVASAIASFLPGFLWIGSIYVEEPHRQALIWIAIPLDIFGPVLLVIIQRGGSWMGERIDSWAKRCFEFMPGANIEHKIERTNAFVGLVFGYSVVALLYQSAVPFGINAFFGKAALGLIQSFTFNWLYFEIDTFNMHTHAIRRHFFSSFLWISVHLPFVMAFTLAASALSKIVLAHDTGEADPHDLLEPYSTRSEEELPIGLIWYYCAGLAIALFCMGLISISHRSKTIPNARLKKSYRLGIRFLVAIAILLLPLAHEHLNSLELVATTTCLTVVVLFVDIAGSSCTGDAFWGLRQKRHCKYSAKCSMGRRELQEKARTGETVNVEELAKRERNPEMKESLIV